jgi:hypothetical protein
MKFGRVVGARLSCPAHSAARSEDFRLSVEAEPRCAADAGPPEARSWRSRISGAPLARAEVHVQISILS